MKPTTLMLLSVLMLSLPIAAQDKRTAAGDQEIIKAVSPALVRVEYTLQYDKADEPEVQGVAEKCPNCGSYHSFGAGNVVAEERPMEQAGVLIAPTKVVTRDIVAHPRFIKKIEVRFGDQVVPARLAAIAADRPAAMLELEQPLTGARPLEFDEAAQPSLAVQYQLAECLWTTTVSSFTLDTITREDGQVVQTGPANAVVVDKAGKAVALATGLFQTDGAWKGSPAKWEWVDQQQVQKLLADVQSRAASSILRVTLDFRSPRKSSNVYDRYRYRGDEDDNSMHQNVLGVLLDNQTVLVLKNLRTDATARLEKIAVCPPQGEPVPASFQCSLTDFGAMLVKLQQPLDGAAVMFPDDIRKLRDRLLLAAEVQLQGEKRVQYVLHNRFSAFEMGYRRNAYPEIGPGSQKTFIFDQQGRLAAMPIVKRPKAGQDQGRYGGDSPILTGVGMITATLADIAAASDPSNVPLTEEQEARLAWLGVELQSLDRELARANNVSDITSDGQTGAIVSYVYAGSPADKAGIKQGAILLQLHVKDQPKPINVKIEQHDFDFPWDRLGDLPEQYYDQIPAPWPMADNTFTRTLTEIGFGKDFTADFFIDGKLVPKDFQVTQSPDHYDSAPRFKSAPLGMTVRDLTYEVRRYMQKKPDAPGVIISKLESGSKASVAGLKPFEVITHVNGVAVMNVKDFEKALAQGEELRFSVSRMAKGRQVKIKMAATSKPAGAPASQPAASSPPGAPASGPASDL